MQLNPLLAFVGAQVVMIGFSFVVGSKEAIYLNVMRKLPYGNPNEKPYHLYGWISAAIFGAVLALFQSGLTAQILTAILSAILYWIFYELPINTSVFGHWNYVGRTAAWDKFLLRTFGLKAELWSVILKAAGVVILNLLFILL